MLPVLGYFKQIYVFIVHTCIYDTESSDRALVGIDLQLPESQWIVMRKGQCKNTWLPLAL